MSKKAIVGKPAKLYPPTNVFDFAFSQPFRPGSTALRDAPTVEHSNHIVEPISASKPIFVDAATGVTVTWRNIYDDTRRLATGLRQLLAYETGPYENVSPVVLIHSPNCIHYASIVFAVFAAGYTASLANPLLTATELQHVISLARPAAIITTADGWPAIHTALKSINDTSFTSALTNRSFILGQSLDVPVPTPPQTRSLHELYQHDTNAFQSAQLTKHAFLRQAALILWSSGTTGKSKGVCHSHAALVHNTIGMWHTSLFYDSHERWLGFVPFYHVYGFAVLLMLAPACGATMFVMPKFSPQVMLDAIQRERITCLHLAPPVALLLAKSPMIEGVDMSSLKYALSGGAPLGADVIEMVWRRLGIMVFMGYGLSEAGSVTHQHASDWEELAAQRGNTGVAIPGVEVRIVSIDDPKETLSLGEEGEVCCRSRVNMLGYLNNPEATKEVLDQDGWYRTGDVGRLDDSGALFITDRMKEMIKVKGLQVSPADLEATLNASPQIADAAVIPVVDESTVSEYPRAYLVPADSRLAASLAGQQGSRVSTQLEKLATHVKEWMEKRTANYKWLRGNVVFIQEVPKSPSGKILRRLLKDVKGVEVRIYDTERNARAKL